MQYLEDTVDDSDFETALRGNARPSRRDGEEFLARLTKTAASPAAIGAAAGAVGLGAATFLTNAKGRDGKSMEQKAKARNELATRELEKSPDFMPRLRRATAKYKAELADVFAQHPEKAALLATPFGASIGAMIAKKLSK